MTTESLCVMLTDMLKETNQGHLKWRLEAATSEYRDEQEKPTVEADGKTWTVDECYVAYSCEFRGKEFSMITYENIEKSGEAVRSINMVFLPPLGVRIFHLGELSSYAVETSAVLVDKVHRLWETLLGMYRDGSKNVTINAREIAVSEMSIGNDGQQAEV